MTPLTRLTTVTAVILALVSGVALGQEAEAPSNTAESLANLAIADLAAWKNKSARKTLQKGRAKYGSTPEFKTAWALLEIQEGANDNQKKVDKGIKSLTQMTKKKSVDAVATYYRGEVLYQQSKRKEAGAAWQTAAGRAGELVAADPKDATAQFYLGASLVRAKEFGKARKALQKAKRGGFDPAMVHHQVGLSYLFSKKWEKARHEFDKGLEVDPRYAPMYFWRAMAWDKIGRKDNMLNDLDQYVKLAPQAPDAGKARALLSAAGR